MFKPRPSAQTASASDAWHGFRREDALFVENEAGAAPAVILCDHASNVIPASLADLGLAPEDLERHIAWDPGALGVARELSRRIDAPLVAGRVSRLVIDTNRDPDLFDSIPERSEATEIPGNAGLTPAERVARVRGVYAPFHEAAAALVRRKCRSGAVALIGVHTFTPVYRMRQRPWHVGIVFDRDRRLAALLVDHFRAQPDLVVGENEPYSPRDRVYHGLDRHGQANGLPSVMIEIRNDLVATPPSQAQWGERFATAIAGALPLALATEPGQPAAPACQTDNSFHRGTT
jgi:predicted N-formylglutamate amidohydrolase